MGSSYNDDRPFAKNVRFTMTVEELKLVARQLSPAERAELATDLLLSLDALSESEIEHLWLEEASRRDAEIDAGTARLIPGDQVIADARARLR
ncbi:MAG: addiction module protein [Coriobacteriia bacterium]|nr:addiction module protein [Coriobacteriia bacterium]